MAKSPDFSYLNADGKRVHGAAAFLHYVYTECNGIVGYNDEVGKAYIESFMKEISASVNEGLTKTIRKKRFKKVV